MEPTLVDLIVSGGHLLTMDEQAPEIADGAIAVDAGRIVASGSRADLVAGRPGGLEEAFFATIGGGAA
jgi:predicted amidohydrolase YtcJ